MYQKFRKKIGDNSRGILEETSVEFLALILKYSGLKFENYLWVKFGEFGAEFYVKCIKNFEKN